MNVPPCSDIIWGCICAVQNIWGERRSPSTTPLHTSSKLTYYDITKAIPTNINLATLTTPSALLKAISRALADAAAAENAVASATVARETHPVQLSVRPGYHCNV